MDMDSPLVSPMDQLGFSLVTLLFLLLLVQVFL
jgi:hypothetical protein